SPSMGGMRSAKPAPGDVPDSAPNVRPSDPPVIAFFDVDNTLLRRASIFHIGRGAFRRRLITLGDIIGFGWMQLRFIAVGENHRDLEAVRERALEFAGGHSVVELEDLANEVYVRYIEP